MNTPAFWYRPAGALAFALAPLGWIYAGTTAWRLAHGTPARLPVPVICVGNLTAGGTGKTPIVRDLAARLAARRRSPAILSRGYGGSERGPLKVDSALHQGADVGDEPLLLAGDAACWVAADRAEGGWAAVAGGADIVVMDDGLQNPALEQDLRLVVADGTAGFGNGRAIPAGPLRETVARGLARAHALIVVGEDRAGLAARFAGRLPILTAKLEPRDAGWLAGTRVAALAGIGQPGKFRETLIAAGAEIASFNTFPDHHFYSGAELDAFIADAERHKALPVTTEKDWVRLASEWRSRIRPVIVGLAWQRPAAIEALLDLVTERG
ncbi:MAG TPA: tetraacyldisaccharide 4'-kinase [Alphaproteobacteria bacterium]|jgi:tetraacyldisaccharide 4'-kinase|nr:tetraacyldisaccharide 4'-kinase [Alphaproteobacteria bacterium]